MKIKSEVVSYRLLGNQCDEKRRIDRIVYSSYWRDKNDMEEVILLSSQGRRYFLKSPFTLPEESLEEILSNSTRFRVSYSIYRFEGTFKFPFPKPYSVLRFMANNGNLPDEELDDLYDEVQEQIEKDKQEKLRIAEEERINDLKKEVRRLESEVKQLNLEDSNVLRTIISDPSSLEKVTELERFCESNNVNSTLLFNIKRIPSQYDVVKIREDINRCKKNIKANSSLATITAIVGCIFGVLCIFGSANAMPLLGWGSFGVVLLSIILKIGLKRDVSYSEQTLNFIKNFFK